MERRKEENHKDVDAAGNYIAPLSKSIVRLVTQELVSCSADN